MGCRAFCYMKHAKTLGPLGHRWYSPDEFRTLAEGGGSDKHAAVRSYLTCEAVEKIDGPESRTIRFVISTDAIDRSRDIINQAGWRLDNFLKNPVVLFGHNYWDLPIAQCTAIRVEGGKLVAEAKFVDAETYEFADTVYKMLLGGYLRATSVGFNPLRWMWNEERRGVDFEEQELLEFSVVPVPANPEALIAASAAGIDLSPMKDWIQSVLKSGGEQMGLTKDQLASITETLEKAVPVKVKSHPDCPNGAECPYEDGMEHCPNGDKCPMKKVSQQGQNVVLLVDIEKVVAAAIKPLQDQLAVLTQKKSAEQDVDDQLLEILDVEGVELELPDYVAPATAEDDLDIDEATVRQAMSESFREGLKELVGAELNRLRGRLD